jgi:K+-sensing histidine kinase KdpD
MKIRGIIILLLFVLFFISDAYSQQAQVTDEYNTWKLLGVLAIICTVLVLLYRNTRHKTSSQITENKTDTANTIKKLSADESNEEVVVAIALALHEAAEEVHDFENTIITFKKTNGNYSPWGLKNFTLKQTPLKK